MPVILPRRGWVAVGVGTTMQLVRACSLAVLILLLEACESIVLTTDTLHVELDESLPRPSSVIFLPTATDFSAPLDSPKDGEQKDGEQRGCSSFCPYMN